MRACVCVRVYVRFETNFEDNLSLEKSKEEKQKVKINKNDINSNDHVDKKTKKM